MTVRLWVFGPLLVAALGWGIAAGHLPPAACALWVAAGALIWTALEYAMHRFAFHGFAPHYEHHAVPTDPVYILAPLALSLPMAAGLSGLLWLAAGSSAAASLMMAGVIAGYLAYELLHIRIHSTNRGGAMLRALRRHHYYHHFASDRVCYGVTSPLWDLVFGSLPGRRRFLSTAPPVRDVPGEPR